MKVNLPNLPSICSAMLFDLDGTLIDSSTSIEAAWKAWSNRHGLDFQEVNRLSFGMRTVDSIKMFLPDCNLEEELEILEEYECTLVEELKAFIGANSLLKQLNEKSWGIVTSGSNRVANRRIDVINLPKPKVLVSADDVFKGKPDPEGYLMAAQKLNVHPSECIVVEDSTLGVRAGKAAKMKVIAIASSHSNDELEEADLVLDSIDYLNKAVSI